MTVEIDDELTPVPQAPPEISDAEKERRRRITGQDLRSWRDSQPRPPMPTLPELTQVVQDMLVRMDANQTSLTQVIDLLNRRDAGNVLKDMAASQALLIKVADTATGLAAQHEQLAAIVDHYRHHGPGAGDAAAALGSVQLLEAKLYGSDLDAKDDGDIGEIKSDVGYAKTYARRFFVGSIGALLGSIGVVLTIVLSGASDGGALRNQVDANGAMIKLLQVQIQTIQAHLFGFRTGDSQ